MKINNPARVRCVHASPHFPVPAPLYPRDRGYEETGTGKGGEEPPKGKTEKSISKALKILHPNNYKQKREKTPQKRKETTKQQNKTQHEEFNITKRHTFGRN